MCFETTENRLHFPLKTILIQVLIFGLLFFLAAVTPAAAQTCTGIPDQECAVLYALYDGTGGSQWTDNTNWLTAETVNNWYGVTVDNGHVIEISLIENGLAGPIPPELGTLSSLEGLYFQFNGLTGTIPPELGNLDNLEWLHLQRNSLTGSIPPELADMSSLEWLYLNQNDLTGEIPPELGSLSNLIRLNVYNNNLSGSIPPELGNLSNLYYLDLYGNNLTGTIPPELGNLPNIFWLYLHNNELSGTIPPELGTLTSLDTLSLYRNNLTGTIPPELGNLANLESLRLGDNNLTGAIPTELSNLANLEELTLYINSLSGEIPAELGSLPEFYALDLHGNNLTGEIPPELGNLAKLEYLYLQENSLIGEIPPELGDMSSLILLNLDSNDLTGELPPELGNLTNLSILGISYNKLSGEIPAEFGSMESLRNLAMLSNNLTGEIPSELGNLTELETLWLPDNSLTGEIPPELGDLAKLEWLMLYSNSLSGDLPDFLAALPDNVDLRWNCLSASDPAVLSAMEAKHSNKFMSTQTVAPENVSAETAESSGTLENRVEISWDPISYIADDGGYQVYYQKGSSPDYYYYGMTADKETSSMMVSNLEPGVDYTFHVNTVTRAHTNNYNALESPDSETDSAISGTLSRAFIPVWKQAAEYFTGVVVSNFGDTSFGLNLAAYDSAGILEPLPLVQNPAFTTVGAGLQESKLGWEYFQGDPYHEDFSWIELGADNSNKMGSIFLYGVNDTRMLDGAESQSAYAKKLYFTRPLDDGFFLGRGPEIQMCIVNPTDDEVTVTCTLKGYNGESSRSHTIPSMGFLTGDSEDLTNPGHGLYNAYMEIEVTEGAGVVGFSRIEFPGIRTALGMNAVEPSSSKKFYSAQLAHGMNIVTHLKLVNTSDSNRTVTLTAIGDDGMPLADPVQVYMSESRTYSTNLGTLFGLDGPGIDTGSLVVETDGSGIIGDIVFANGDTLEYAMSLLLQDKLFQEAVFNHIANLPTVFTGFAFYNPGEETATVLIEAFDAEAGDKVAEKTLILDPGERIARTLTDSDIWPAFPTQSGGYIRIQSDQPIAGQQLFGDRDLRYMAAVPPTTRVEAMFD
jgi:Leucine-rich repeat (LRR) protein